MALTLEGQKMVLRGKLLGLQGDYDRANSYVEVYESRNSDFWAENVTAWRKARAEAWVELEVGKLELADFEARH